MTAILEPIDTKSMPIVTNERDVLQDLFTYLNYVRPRGIKRLMRTSTIRRSDLVRIARLLEVDPPEQDDWMDPRPHWITFIDRLALSLHLVSHDANKANRDPTNQEPSSSGNFLRVDESQLSQFLEISPADQEHRILHALTRPQVAHPYGGGTWNEFFDYGPLSSLDAFERAGAFGIIIANINFPETREFLLDLLRSCPPGQWLSVQSLITHLKANHPFFLIPQPIPKSVHWGRSLERYDCFYEFDSQGLRPTTIPPEASDAFERVEGRYIERFLEYVPFVMRFVDLAYDPEPYSGPYPSRGILKAFRVNERFWRLMRNESGSPKVTVQPNFDIVVESDFYPAKTVHAVAAVSEQVSRPAAGHGAYLGMFKLTKAAVAAALVRQPDLDIIALLRNTTERDLPPNVQVELEEWAGHADQFILYEGLAVLETETLPAEVEAFVAERVAPSVYLVRSPEQVFATLEELGQVPLLVRHRPWDLELPAAGVVSVFPKQPAPDGQPKQARSIKVSRIVMIGYQFPDEEAFDAAQRTLAGKRCPFQSDPQAHTISIRQEEHARFDEALAGMAGDFLIEVE